MYRQKGKREILSNRWKLENGERESVVVSRILYLSIFVIFLESPLGFVLGGLLDTINE